VIRLRPATHALLGLGVALWLAAAAPPAAAQGPDTAARHGVSVFGDLKYPAGFPHFDYVNPDAPKGGALSTWNVGTFETMNPFLLKGREEDLAAGLLFDTLMTRAEDEPDAMYGLVAQSVEVPEDGRWVAFMLNPKARFNDGTPITAEDVVFSFDTLVAKGHPRFRIVWRDVEKAEVTGPRTVRFTFKPGRHRDLPVQLAALPVLSKAYYRGVTFDSTTFEAPLGSGPYRAARITPGRSVTYERVKDWWAKDLPVNRGRYNFDAIRIDYYRDRDIAFEAFFSGAYDFREEFTARNWATQYDKPPVRNGLVKRATLPDESPTATQLFVFNLRRDTFKDWRVRAAFDLAFDYEWTNKTLFYGQYERTNSMYENSELAAHAAPTPEEIALLEPFRGQVPEEVFTTPYKSPVSDGSGNIRARLRQAIGLLRDAGWTFKNGKLVDAKGGQMTAEFLLFEASFQRIIGPYQQNLKRLGIDARIRIVDSANFKYRMDHFDFDIIIQRFAQTLTPGIEQRGYFGSEFANVPGARNLSGISDPAVDALIGRMLAAESRPALVTATRALDRVLMWRRYTVPQWYKGSHNVAYWDKYDRPERKPPYARGVIDTWWYNPQKAAMIAAGKAPPAR
jgi:microcin C transport system substrate-binding protein